MSPISDNSVFVGRYGQQRWWPALTIQERWGVCAILLGAFVVRCIGLDTESLWIDEAASWGFSRLSLAELWLDAPSFEPHPPLFYTFLKFWTSIFGDTEIALRGLPMLASVVTVYVVFLIGRLVAGRDGTVVGLAGAAVVAFHPVQIYFAQEARSYALLTLGFSMALLALAWWSRNPQALATAMQRQSSAGGIRRKQAAVLFVFGAALALWMHHTAILVVGSALAAGAVVVLLGAQDRFRTALALALLGVAIVVCWLPCGMLLLRAIDELGASGHIPAPNHRSVIYGLDYLFGTGSMSFADNSAKHLISIALVGVVASAGAAALAKKGLWNSLALLCASIAVPIVAALLGSWAVTPMFVERVLIWTEISYCILIAASLLWLPGNILRCVGLGAILLFFTAVRIIDPAHKEPWRKMVALVETESVSGDLMFSWFDYPWIPMGYYKVADRVKADRLRLWTGTGQYPTMEEAISPKRRMPVADAMQRVMEAEKTHQAIWIVTRASINDKFMVSMTEYLTRMRGPPIQRIHYQTPGSERTNPPTILLQYVKRGGS